VKVAIYMSDKGFDHVVLGAIASGFAAEGVRVSFRDKYAGIEPGVDVAVTRGVVGRTRQVIEEYRAAGKIVLYVDKGYLRLPSTIEDGISMEYVKVSLNGFQPLTYLMTDARPADRWERIKETFGKMIHPIRKCGLNVVYAGPSQKNAEFHGLGDATEYANLVIDSITELTDAPIIYRPKQSWGGAAPVKGSRFSTPPETLSSILADARVFIVHNSNSCVEAALDGVPVISLGPSIARPISSRGLDMINSLYVPSEADREKWIANICWWQWTIPELASGAMWRFVRRFV
jgi:hypothetical protein